MTVLGCMSSLLEIIIIINNNNNNNCTKSVINYASDSIYGGLVTAYSFRAESSAMCKSVYISSPDQHME